MYRLIFFFLAAAFCYGADVDWQLPPVNVGAKDGAYPNSAEDLSMNSAGDAALVWIEPGGSCAGSTFTIGAGVWSAPNVFSVPGGGMASFPKVSVDAMGNAVAIWVQTDSMANPFIWAATYSSGAWTGPTAISSTNPSLTQLSVSAYGNGNAAAIWNAGGGSLYGNTLMGGVWAGETNFHGGFIQAPMVAVDGSGNGAAVWYETVGNFVVFGSKYNNGIWTPAGNISMNGVDDARNPDFSINENGTGIVVWGLTNGALDVTVQSSYLDVMMGTWSAPIDMGTFIGAFALDPEVAIDGSGNAVVVTIDPGNVVTAFLPFGGAWGAQTNFGAGGNPAVAMNANGDAVIAWAASAVNVHIFASTATYPGAWSTPVDMTNVGEDNFFASVGIDSTGNTVAAWNNGSGAPFFTQAVYGTLAVPPVPPPAPVPAPLNGGGFQTINRFPTVADFINVISWENPGGVAYFRVYRGDLNTLIGQTGETSYQDHRRRPGAQVIYYVTAVDASGAESSPLEISVAPL